MRTKKSFYNFITDIFPYFIISVLSIFRIRFIINVYGPEINGFLQLIVQLFFYLTLAEAGFGTAVMYKYYKPLAKKDNDKICSIFWGSKLIFKKISLIMFFAGVFVAVILPFVIARGSLSITFIFVMFLLYSVQYFIEYMFVLPHTTLLQADQNQFVVNLYRNGSKILFTILELFLLYTKTNLYLIILVNLMFTVVYSILMVRKTNSLYPFLKTKSESIDVSSVAMTKDVFAHKISSVVFSKTDSIILSLFNLSFVTIYTSYNYIVDFLTTVISKMYNSMRASYCNIVVSNSVNEENKFFNLFFTMSFFLGVFCSITFFYTVNPVISVWIGERYVLNFASTILFSLIILGRIVINPVYLARDSKGLYKETKIFTIMQSLANIIISLLLVRRFQIFGILLGTVISQYLILIPFNIKIVYEKVIKEKYDKLYLNISVTLVSIILIVFVQLVWNINYLHTSFRSLSFYMLKIGIINFCIIFLVFAIFNKEFRNMLKFYKQTFAFHVRSNR